MKVLLIGSGGREHALAWKIAQSPKVSRVFVAPGNAGTAREPRCENILIAADDIQALLDFAQENDVDLTVVGPEAPLVAGIVDRFSEAGRKCFGPSQGAAQLEGSKAFTKDFLAKYEIPTAAYGNFTDIKAATEYIRQCGAPIVVKADGLAAGKGVIVAQNEEQAIEAAADMLAGNAFGEAGHRVVIEEFLQGEEASFICMVDGKNVLPMASSQDHKARDDGDKGPNTGGMGAYSPAPVIDDAMHERILREVIEPTVAGMQAEGHPFTGFLYAGVMIGNDGIPKVLEFNVRFGDPETQPVMMRVNFDLVDAMLAALDSRLDTLENINWDPRAALGVVLAARGYPEGYTKGEAIGGLDAFTSEDLKVFHAGTANHNGETVSAGGRVLCVTALGESVAEAKTKAYQAVSKINWPGAYYRSDIGYRAVARERQSC